MKLNILSFLAALFLLVQANESWYSADRNVTCTGHDDGHISCESGHVGDAPLLDAAASTPAIRGREPSPLDLEKRVSCNIDGVTKGLACFTHCFLINYCNSHCDSNNICHCSCYDESPWPLVCVDTTCA